MNRPEPDATDDFDPASEDPVLLSAAREYLADLEAGRPPDRAAFLNKHAAVAAELAGYLDAMELVHGAGAGRPLAPRASGDSRSESPTFEAAPLGDYRLLREVGRGGMGQVYEAVQLSLGRRVAVKVLPFAAALDADRLRRFKNEAHAAACLDHPNIVTVYAVGCERGVYFYAMQFIDGRDLAALIRDLRRQAGLAPEVDGAGVGDSLRESPAARGASGLPSPAATTVQAVGRSTQKGSSPTESFRTAARLARQAAEALHHAHQQGVVHRDLKPANLMVDAAGKLWVTDFGLAQVQNDPRLTATGALIGTLRYMSPEQAAGEQPVDHRTDVYSLGATLYELLALRPAFDGRDRAALLRQISQDEPPPLRRANPAVPADLETVVAKAMAKSPADRYATAQALADDLRRFLEDKPILARRPSLLDKTYKWARRRRGLVAGAMAALLLAVLGLTTSTALVARANARLADEKDKEANERQRAQDAARKAREVLNVFTQVAEELPDHPDVRPARRKLLETALGYYKDFIVEQGDDPDAQAELTASQWRAGNLLEEMGKADEAMFCYGWALRGPGGPPSFSHGGPPRRPPDERGKPGLIPLRFYEAALLLQAPVQQELKLSDEQKQRVAGLAAPLLGPRGPEDRRQLNVADWLQILEPAQLNRLKQIILQKQGTHALNYQEVAEELGLTTQQHDAIRGIEEETVRTLLDSWHNRSPLPEGFWKDADNRRLQQLTDAQKARWMAMKGEPFQGEIHIGPPPHDDHCDDGKPAPLP